MRVLSPEIVIREPELAKELLNVLEIRPVKGNEIETMIVKRINIGIKTLVFMFFSIYLSPAYSDVIILK